MPMAEVAAECGFSSQQQMTTVMRRLAGVPLLQGFVVFRRRDLQGDPFRLIQRDRPSNLAEMSDAGRTAPLDSIDRPGDFTAAEQAIPHPAHAVRYFDCPSVHSHFLLRL